MKRTYYPNYFSIEDIFVTQEKIPCTVEQPLNHLGFLDPSSESADLKAGQDVELPLWYILQVQKERSRNQFYKWVAPSILIHSIHVTHLFAESAFPIFTNRLMAKFAAPMLQPSIWADLTNISTSWVAMSRLLIATVSWEKWFMRFVGVCAIVNNPFDLSPSPLQTCRSRMKYLKDLCNNINNENRNDHKLDYIENLLFDVGCRTNRNISEWLQQNTVNIKTSQMVVNHRKRRRALMEAENAVTGSSQR